MKFLSRRLWIAIFVIAALALLYRYGTRKESVPVSLYTVDRGRVEAIVANTRAGTIKACRRARLSPATGGQVARLTVTEGDRVTQGQVLVELWNADLAAQLNLAQREATTAAANRKEACTRAEQARREADRLTKLRSKGVVSEDDLDRAASNAQAVTAACQAAGAQIQASAARIEAAKATLERTVLTAPFDGIVAEVNGEIGEFVTPSPIGVATPPAIDLIDENCVFVSAPIDEVDAPQIATGMPVRISLDAFPGRHCPGHVQRIAPYVLEVEKQARTVEIEAAFDAVDQCMQLLPGYSADVEVIRDVAEDVLRIPSDAVMEGNRVLVYRPADGLLQDRSIETGITNWEWTAVVSGLQPDELVVTSVNAEGVEPGAYGKPDKLLSESATAP